MTRPLAAALAIVQRDALLFFSYRWRFVTQGLAILFTTVLFFYISRLVRVEPFTSPDDYFAYVVVGLVVLELLTAALVTVPAMVRQELLTATFERLAIAPLGPRGAVLAMAVFPIALSLLVSGLTLLLALAVSDIELRSTAPLAVPALALVALAFTPLTVALSAVVLVAKQAGSAATFVVTGLSLASGAFFPVGLLPAWIEWVAEVQPLGPALELLRHVLLGTPVDGGAWLNVVKLAGFAAVALPAALVAFDTADRWCRRRGTLTEF